MFKRFCQDWTTKPEGLCIYFGVLIVLIFLCVYYLRKIAPERMQNIPNINSITGRGLGLNTDATVGALTSGATMRFNSQQSQPNMGLRNTAYNRDAVATALDHGIPAPGMIVQGRVIGLDLDAASEESALNLANGASNNASAITGNKKERLVNYRYAPQFDDSFSDELNKYQSMTPPIEYSVLDGTTQKYASGEGFNAGTGAMFRNAQSVGPDY